MLVVHVIYLHSGENMWWIIFISLYFLWGVGFVVSQIRYYRKHQEELGIGRFIWESFIQPPFVFIWYGWAIYVPLGICITLGYLIGRGS